MSDFYKFEFNEAGDIARILELEDGRLKVEKPDYDERFYSITEDHSTILKEEPKHGQVEWSVYQVNQDGFWREALKGVGSFDPMFYNDALSLNDKDLGIHTEDVSFAMNGVVYTDDADDDLYAEVEGLELSDDAHHVETDESYVVNGVVYTDDADDDLYAEVEGAELSEHHFKYYSGDKKIIQSGELEIKTNNNVVKSKSLDFKTALFDLGEETNSFSLHMEADMTNSVTVSDVISQLKHVAGLHELRGVQLTAADLDCDGKVDISDVVLNLKAVVGLGSTNMATVVDKTGNTEFTLDNIDAELYVIAPGDIDFSWQAVDIM
ncbi:MAG: hypothetical protein ACON5C_09875 [Alphaproteobacteria bacterium]